MAKDSEHAVDVLNGLVQAALDSTNGYEKATQLVRNPRFKSLFQQRAQARRHLTQEIKNEVRAVGEQPPEDGSILGLAHLWFAELRDKIAGQSDKALIEEVERSESFVCDQFRRAADDASLSPQAHQLIARAYAEISSDHDEANALKGEFH